MGALPPLLLLDLLTKPVLLKLLLLLLYQSLPYARVSQASAAGLIHLAMFSGLNSRSAPLSDPIKAKGAKYYKLQMFKGLYDKWR